MGAPAGLAAGVAAASGLPLLIVRAGTLSKGCRARGEERIFAVLADSAPRRTGTGCEVLLVHPTLTARSGVMV